MTLEETIRDYRKDPKPYLEMMLKYSYARLGVMLDVVRQQKKLAYDQQKKDSFEWLNIREQLIMQARVIKGEEEKQEPPRKRSAKQKIKTVEEETTSLEPETEISNESPIEESIIHSERKDEQEQLLLDF